MPGWHDDPAAVYAVYVTFAIKTYQAAAAIHTVGRCPARAGLPDLGQHDHPAEHHHAQRCHAGSCLPRRGWSRTADLARWQGGIWLAPQAMGHRR